MFCPSLLHSRSCTRDENVWGRVPFSERVGTHLHSYVIPSCIVGWRQISGRTVHPGIKERNVNRILGCTFFRDYHRKMASLAEYVVAIISEGI